MSRRKPDPVTGELQLTFRERIFINEYIKNGGNGKEAAIAAGYGAARADQSAYQVLHRIQVHQQIQERISEFGLSANEVIGTLASFMRGNIADLLDDDCNFDLALVKERGLGNLLKTITCTTREIKTEPGQPPHIARDYRIQLHSPVQAASILARLIGLNHRTLGFQPSEIADADHPSPPGDLPDNMPDNPDNELLDDLRANDHSEPTEADSLHGVEEILDPSFWMERLIKLEMERQGRSRSEVIQTLIQLRPEAAEFIRPEPDSKNDPRTTPSEISPASHCTAQALDPKAVDDTKAVGKDRSVENVAKAESATPKPNPHSVTAPLPQDSVPSSCPTEVSQTLSPEQLKRIADIVRNSQKLNTTQCLESDSDLRPNAQSGPVSKPEAVPKTKT